MSKVQVFDIHGTVEIETDDYPNLKFGVDSQHVEDRPTYLYSFNTNSWWML